MKMKFSKVKWLSIYLVVMIVVTCSGGNICMATEDSGTATTGAVTIYVTDDSKDIIVTPGTTTYISVPVKSNTYCQINKISLITKDTPFTLNGSIELLKEGTQNPVKDISNIQHYLTFSIDTSETAKNGTYEVNASFLCKDNYEETLFTTTLLETIKIKVTGEKTKASLSITDIECQQGMEPGDTTDLTFQLNNLGTMAAENVKVTVEGFADDGVLPGSEGTTQKITKIEGSGNYTVSFPIRVSANAVTGSKALTISVEYKAASTDTDKSTETTSTYVEVKGKTTASDTAKTLKLLVSDVKQNPSVPVAGESLQVSFNLKNINTKDVYSITITPTNLSATNFSPVQSEPYQFVKKIKAGESVTVSNALKVSDQVVEGLNQIEYAITYKDASGTEYSDTVKVFVINVKNPEEETAGVPKLIISDYSTGDEDLKAGQTFTFAFDIHNTHSNLSANNIKVTLSSDENTFAITEGSNSFYLSSIKAGETQHKEIELRVKADCVTKAYPLKIQFEYEYEGMKIPEDAVSSGLTVSETLNLQVMENSRPTVSNIVVGTYDQPMTNTPCGMMFDFYNMGKSILYNVTARIESSDFVATQETVFIGNVEAGAGNSHEMEVTPLVENVDAVGTLIVTYEDSNGNSYEIPTEFTAYIQSVTTIDDPGMFDPGMFDNSGEAKKPIVKVWIFVIIDVVLFLFGMFIVRKVIISLYKRKLRRAEEREL
ncbi:COG1361 S-layer family protein [Anaeromicropila populeti]|uniref:Uncharacterized conserved protein n=1 Tax=Anaeromicropila populeti TaxID=37658 RepID=A0A1I6HL98_9FIRM|nr:hypothetical protein [Anaeromicropila populeti]SFR55239.1 Uncharacterized conserved protein [Anaeromicropila populeti]